MQNGDSISKSGEIQEALQDLRREMMILLGDLNAVEKTISHLRTGILEINEHAANKLEKGCKNVKVRQ